MQMIDNKIFTMSITRTQPLALDWYPPTYGKRRK